jgi:hypothetical protein
LTTHCPRCATCARVSLFALRTWNAACSWVSLVSLWARSTHIGDIDAARGCII